MQDLARNREFRLTVAHSKAAFVAELQGREVPPAFISPPKRPHQKSGEMLFSSIIPCVDLLLFLPCCVLVSSRLTVACNTFRIVNCRLQQHASLSLPLVIVLHRSHRSITDHQLGGTGLSSSALPAATQPSVRPSSVGRVNIAIATATASAAISAAASATSAAPFASVSCACLHIMCVYITMAICQCTGDSGQRGVRKRSA